MRRPRGDVDIVPLDRGEILHCPVLGVTGDLMGTQFSAEAGSPEQILGGLDFLHVGRGHEHSQDNPRPPTIDDIVVLVTQPRTPVLQSHGGRVRIGGSHAEFSRALVGTAHHSTVRMTTFGVQVMPLLSVLCQRRDHPFRRLACQRRSSLGCGGNLIIRRCRVSSTFSRRRIKQMGQVRLNGKAWLEGSEHGISRHLGCVGGEFLTLDEFGGPALFDHVSE